MTCEVEYTDEFEQWRNTLGEGEFVPIADALYSEHLETLEKEKSKNG